MPPRLSPTPGAAMLATLASLTSAIGAVHAIPHSPTPAGPAPAAVAAPEPWRAALRFETAEAADAFARLHAENPTDPRLALAHASMLLARQPRTQGNVMAARATLEKLAASAAPPGAEIPANSPALAARLLLARIASEHLSPPRPEEARELLEALLRDHAGHPLADQAALDLALLAAYPAPGAPEFPRDEARTRIDALRARVRSPEVVRELHALQGRLHLEHDEPRLALPHLVAARAIGYLQPDRDAEADLSIANLVPRYFQWVKRRAA